MLYRRAASLSEKKRPGGGWQTAVRGFVNPLVRKKDMRKIHYRHVVRHDISLPLRRGGQYLHRRHHVPSALADLISEWPA
jgi:hypothetical protein